MAVLEFNEKTKQVAFEPASVEGLSHDDELQQRQTINLLNMLTNNLVHCQDEVPPVNSFNETITNSARKLVRSGVELMKNNKPLEAIKLFNTALEMVLRRPAWEPTVRFLEEVSQCLAARCDANRMLNNFEDAFADASLLMLMKPMDHMNHFRKAAVLIHACQIDEAENLLKTALSMSPNNPIYLTALRNARSGITEKPNSQ